jgi:hypothetical protein
MGKMEVMVPISVMPMGREGSATCGEGGAGREDSIRLGQRQRGSRPGSMEVVKRRRVRRKLASGTGPRRRSHHGGRCVGEGVAGEVEAGVAQHDAHKGDQAAPHKVGGIGWQLRQAGGRRRRLRRAGRCGLQQCRQWALDGRLEARRSRHMGAARASHCDAQQSAPQPQRQATS